jgi:hypothetical protein
MADPFKFEFSVLGDKEIKIGFSRWANKIEDFTPAFEKINNSFYAIERRLFDTEGKSGQLGKWKYLDMKYAEWKYSDKNPFSGRKILELSVDLKRSLTQEGPENIKMISPRQLIMGSINPLLAIHYDGNKNLPRREPISLTKLQKTKWAKIIHRFCLDKATEMGWRFVNVDPDLYTGDDTPW